MWFYNFSAPAASHAFTFSMLHSSSSDHMWNALTQYRVITGSNPDTQPQAWSTRRLRVLMHLVEKEWYCKNDKIEKDL